MTVRQRSSGWLVGGGETKVQIDEISHERRVETLLSVLDAQGVDRCVVAGDSANAAVAIAAALQQPERFDGLGIVNGHAWGPGPLVCNTRVPSWRR